MNPFVKEFRTISFIVLIIMIFRSSFFEPFKIPSGSMIPTLLVGDFILVNKTSYGLKVPFSDWFSESPIYITGPYEPKRGDIIVFKYPNDTSLNYIKRLVALPGDRINVIEGQVYVNGNVAPMSALGSEESTSLKNYLFKQNNEFPIDQIDIFETQTGDVKHKIQHFNPPRNYLFPPEWIVPEGHYFVMGDNRDNSQDSRFWGFVPFGYIKGKAFLVWLNLNLPIFQPEGISYPFLFYPDRIGKLVY